MVVLINLSNKTDKIYVIQLLNRYNKQSCEVIKLSIHNTEIALPEFCFYHIYLVLHCNHELRARARWMNTAYTNI